jgi:hypothetical protein
MPLALHPRDDTDRHLWDDTIGTIRTADKCPRRPHHVVCSDFFNASPIQAASRRAPQRASERHDDARHDTKCEMGRATMTMVGVAFVWLAIAAVAFVALSALARLSAERNDAELGIVGEAELIDTSYMTT